MNHNLASFNSATLVENGRKLTSMAHKADLVNRRIILTKGSLLLENILLSWSVYIATAKMQQKYYWLCGSEAPDNTAPAAKSLQSCLTLWDPINSSPPGSPVPEILQARTLEWVAISFSNAWKWKVKVKSLSRVRLFETPWAAAHQAPPFMGFTRQECWSGVPLPDNTRASEDYRGMQIKQNG